MANLMDLFAEEEEIRLAQSRAEIAAERAAFEAKSPEERAAITAAREAFWESLHDIAFVANEEDDDDDEEDDGY